MEENRSLLSDVTSESYDASDRPFDFVGMGSETAMLCESDPAMRKKIKTALMELGYQITEPTSTKDALKNMRFHVYDMVVLNESFEMENQETSANSVLNYLANLGMDTRRQIFIALIGDKYRTTDNMAAFNKSVNLVVNPKNIDDFGTIIKRSLDDNNAFYHVFKQSMKKLGRL